MGKVEPPRPHILIVDDDPGMRLLLERQLSQGAYEISILESAEALLSQPELLASADLILMDIMMPGLDGIAAVGRIRSLEQRYLPILLVSSLADTEHRVRGLEAGADDYVTKPVVAKELQARVRAHLRTKYYHDALLQAHSELHETHQALLKTEGLRDLLSRMIVHDLANPLSSVSLALGLMGKPRDPSLVDAETWDLMASQVALGEEMIRQMLDLDKLQSEHPVLHTEFATPKRSIQRALELVEPKAIARHLDVKVNCECHAIELDHSLLSRMVVTLLSSAVRFAPKRSAVEVECILEGEELVLAVSDEGPGIPAQYRTQVFDQYGTVMGDHSLRGYGIGLRFCDVAARAMGGSISIADQDGGGIKFVLRLPSATARTNKSDA